jgi:arylsulfatase A-like enzyme
LRAPRARLLAALAVLPPLVAACSPPDTAVPRTRNAVVVLVDTLRADHLSLYGSTRATTPNLERRARRHGVVFENVRAQAPCTFPSVNSLLTSRSPAVFFAAAAEGSLGIPPEVPSLAGLLAEAGFDTAAVSASPVVRATPSPANPSAGFGAGFATFDEFCYWREAGCVSARARQTIRKLEEPFFLYVHYMDPHDPYRLAEDAALEPRFAGAGPPGADKAFVRAGDPLPVAEHLYGGAADPGLAPADVAHWRDLYDDEILYWDRELEPFLDELDRRFPDTAVVIASDHGEELLEHGHVKHCRTLYDTELRVPLVLLAPGVEPRRVATPVRNLDLLPTVLELVGVPAREGASEGASLLSLLVPGATPSRPRLQFASWADDAAVSDGRFKLILDRTRGSQRLFDLARDPGERIDLAADQPEQSARLRAPLDGWLRAGGRDAHARAREAEALLRSVGYLQ